MCESGLVGWRGGAPLPRAAAAPLGPPAVVPTGGAQKGRLAAACGRQLELGAPDLGRDGGEMPSGLETVNIMPG